MTKTAAITLRPISELDIEAVAAIDEKITGAYHPDEWETRFMYYLRRDPEISLVAEVDGKVVGFMLGEIRSGEFGLVEPAGWIAALGVDPDYRGRAIGRELLEGVVRNFTARGARAVRTLINEETQKELGAFFRKAAFKATPFRTLEHGL